MARIALFVLVVAVALFLVRAQLTAGGGAQVTASDGGSVAGPSEPSAPKRQLDNVRGAAGRIEAQAQERLDTVMERGERLENE